MRKILENIWFLIKLPFLIVRWITRQLFRWGRNTYQTIHFLLTEEEEDLPIEETLPKLSRIPVESLNTSTIYGNIFFGH